MKSLITAVVVLGLLTSCVKTFENEVDLAPEGMGKLIVADGFNYSNNYDTELNLSFPENDGKTVYFDVLSGTVESGASVLFNDVFTKTYHREISLPLHITELSIVAKYTNRIKTFQFDKSNGFNLNLTVDSFVSVVDTSQHASSNDTNARTTQTNKKEKNCYPEEVGVYFPEDFSWSDRYLATYSTKDISNVVIHYNDNSEVKIEDPNINYGDLWYIIIDNTKDVMGVWIKSGCNDSYDGPEYGSYISNPHYQGATDSDGDGIEDALDADPNDADVSTINYYPGEGDYTTFAFEDLWPYQGDYDFNDFVIASNRVIKINASGKVTSVEFDFKLKGIGASFRNDFCISVSDPNDAAEVHLTSSENLVMETMHLGSDTEIRFPAIKDVFGSVGFVNTQTDKTDLGIKTFSLSIRLDGTLDYEDLSTDQYLRINEEEGREVHLPGKKNTSLADETMFQTGHDDSDAAKNKYYLTENNLPWVIEVPSDWRYPKEGALIIDAYPKFKDFAEGQNDLAWYIEDEANIVESFIY